MLKALSAAGRSSARASFSPRPLLSPDRELPSGLWFGCRGCTWLQFCWGVAPNIRLFAEKCEGYSADDRDIGGALMILVRDQLVIHLIAGLSMKGLEPRRQFARAADHARPCAAHLRPRRELVPNQAVADIRDTHSQVCGRRPRSTKLRTAIAQAIATIVGEPNTRSKICGSCRRSLVAAS